MAFKLKAKITGLDKLQKKLKKLSRPVTRAEADAIGRLAVQEMKAMISKGISPVQGGDVKARFAPYKWASARGKDRTGKYPWNKMKDYPSKKVTPVNLELSGKQMSDLDYQVRDMASGNMSVEIGYPAGKSALKEQGHREGVNGQPSRPTIPKTSLGERFASRIEQAYLRILQAAIRKTIDS